METIGEGFAKLLIHLWNAHDMDSCEDPHQQTRLLIYNLHLQLQFSIQTCKPNTITIHPNPPQQPQISI
jgi:hypothetical protein